MGVILTLFNELLVLYSPELANNMNQMTQITNNMWTDLQNGNNNALANDYHQLAQLMRSTQQLIDTAPTKLQDAKENLSKKNINSTKEINRKHLK